MLGKKQGGSLFLFNRRVLRFFRKDGHSWRKKKDGRTVGEAHERLKVLLSGKGATLVWTYITKNQEMNVIDT
jgi:CG-1 domain